jgi:hypothetical protein
MPAEALETKALNLPDAAIRLPFFVAIPGRGGSHRNPPALDELGHKGMGQCVLAHDQDGFSWECTPRPYVNDDPRSLRLHFLWTSRGWNLGKGDVFKHPVRVCFCAIPSPGGLDLCFGSAPPGGQEHLENLGLDQMGSAKSNE